MESLCEIKLFAMFSWSTINSFALCQGSLSLAPKAAGRRSRVLINNSKLEESLKQIKLPQQHFTLIFISFLTFQLES